MVPDQRFAVVEFSATRENDSCLPLFLSPNARLFSLYNFLTSLFSLLTFTFRAHIQDSTGTERRIA